MRKRNKKVYTFLQKKFLVQRYWLNETFKTFCFRSTFMVLDFVPILCPDLSKWCSFYNISSGWSWLNGQEQMVFHNYHMIDHVLPFPDQIHSDRPAVQSEKHFKWPQMTCKYSKWFFLESFLIFSDTIGVTTCHRYMSRVTLLRNTTIMYLQ